MIDVKLLLLLSNTWNQLCANKWLIVNRIVFDRNTWNHLTVCKKSSLGSF